MLIKPFEKSFCVTVGEDYIFVGQFVNWSTSYGIDEYPEIRGSIAPKMMIARDKYPYDISEENIVDILKEECKDLMEG